MTPFSHVQANLQLLTTGQDSDVTIICQGNEYKVHSAIICPKSKYFDVVVNGPFEESHARRIDLSEESPEILRIVIFFLYTDILSADTGLAFSLDDNRESPLPLETRIATFLCADYLRIDSLKNAATMVLPSDCVGGPADGAAGILRSLLESTAADDNKLDLRGVVNKICFQHYLAQGHVDQTVLEVGLKHEPAIWTMLWYLTGSPALTVLTTSERLGLARHCFRKFRTQQWDVRAISAIHTYFTWDERFSGALTCGCNENVWLETASLKNGWSHMILACSKAPSCNFVAPAPPAASSSG